MGTAFKSKGKEPVNGSNCTSRQEAIRRGYAPARTKQSGPRHTLGETSKQRNSTQDGAKHNGRSLSRPVRGPGMPPVRSVSGRRIPSAFLGRPGEPLKVVYE